MGLGMGVLRLEERHCDVVGAVAALLKGRGPMRGLLFSFSQYPAWSQLLLVACPTLPMPYCHPQSLPHCIFSLCPHGSTLLLKKKQLQGDTVPEPLLRPGSAQGASVRLCQHVAATMVIALLSHKNFYGNFLFILGSFSLWS